MIAHPFARRLRLATLGGLRSSLVAAIAVALLVTAAAGATAVPPAPLARNAYQRISSSSEISADLAALAAASPLATVTVVGTTVQQRPIEALRLATGGASRAASRATVLLVGTQHGAAEPAGGEAMLLLARELVAGALRPLLEDLDIVLLPNVNADGRDLGRRGNAAEVNLNTDFVLASQPETQAVIAALDRFAPQVVLDVHESAERKRRTLAREGYLTNFDAQFEVANNPAVPAVLRELANSILLPALLARVSAAGLPARQYIGEITSTRQAITNGGLSLRNLRNMAGVDGALAFLLETRLDDRDQSFPTYRNIKARSERVMLALRCFLDLIHEQRAPILEQVAAARAALMKEPVTLYARYAAAPREARVELPLQRLPTRESVTLAFRDHRHIMSAATIAMPATYVLRGHTEDLLALLDRHKIHYERVSQPLEVPVLAERFAPPPAADAEVMLLHSEEQLLRVAHGAVFIDLVQRHGRLVPLLLDPRSNSSVFRAAPYSSALVRGGDFPVYRVRKGVIRPPPAAP